MGYQTPNQVGYQNIQTTPGIGIESEVSAMRNNQIPNIIGGITKNAMWPMQMAQHITPTITSVTGATAINNLGGASNLFAKGAIPTVGGPLNEAGLPTTIGMKAADGSKLGGGVLNATGKALGALGAAYGALNVGMDFANAGNHRSAGSMAATLGTNTVTTPGGNQYTTRSGFNKDAELAYERQNSINKGIGLTTDAIGTGASIGGLIGNLPGMLIGGAGGLLFGLGASLFGFGNNEDEVKYNTRVVGDNVAMENRQNKTNAYDQDVKDAFYSRSANGTVGAKDGKMPGFSKGKPNARVSHGELVGNFSDGYYRVPGGKDNEDSIKTHLGKEDFVISNKHGLSDYAWQTGDILGALAMQSYLQNTGQMKKYKNGRLPKFENGLLNYLPMALSHGPSLFNNIMNLERARKAPVQTADTYIANPEGARAVNELGRLRFDSDPYFAEANRILRQAQWDARRNVGLGAGGRAIAQNANQAAYFDKLLKITQVADEANNNYRNAYAQALFNLGQNNQIRRMQSAAQRYQWLQQANAAKENWMAQYTKNIDTNLLNMAADYGRMKQYQDALETQKKMLELYDTQAQTDRLKAQAYINSLGNNKTTPAQTAVVSTYVPQLLARPTDDYLLQKVYATAPWRYKQTSKPRSVDPYTNVYNLAPWHQS